MTVCIGADFHARQQTISYLTTEGEKVGQACDFAIGLTLQN